MSFRRRLTLFFVLIVILPMATLAAIVIELAGSSQTGKADARLAAGLETGLSLYRAEQDRAEEATRKAAADPELAAAIRREGSAQARAAAARIVRRGELVSLDVRDARGRVLASVGAEEVVAEARLRLRGAGAGGTLVGSTETAISFVGEVRRVTGQNATVEDSGGTLATTIPVGDAELPPSGEAFTLDLSGEELRAASAELGATGAEELRLTMYGDIESFGFASQRPLVAVALVGFFLFALIFVAIVMRSLQTQIEAMLSAAKRIGQGDFSRKLPVQGDDEMAGLAQEFNSMSDRLSVQMDELRRQRTELEQSVRRIGEAFASGLNRNALFEIVAETAISACEADHARILLAGSQEPEVTVGEEPSETMLEVARTAEREALRTGRSATAREENAFAVSQPLVAEGEDDRREGAARKGRASALSGAAMTVVRIGRKFDAGQRDVLAYLIGQAAASIENVELHELVAEQAVTDELTGLPNNRRFRRWIGTEVARAERFGHNLSLLMLDIDDFKRVNDTYGHLQGDEVLRAIGKVLREQSRGIDEPARYGGEEFAIGLPETDLDGAVEFAERVRERIAATEIPFVDREGSIRVTTSIGAATAVESGGDVRSFIDAADQALYRAKRRGKNRTEKATPSGGKSPPTAKIRGDG